MSAGETKEIELEQAGEAEPVKVEAVVKEIKEKVLPELDDEARRAPPPSSTRSTTPSRHRAAHPRTDRSRGERGLQTPLRSTRS